MSAYRVNDAGFYGEFGGAYVPEILYKTVEDLRLLTSSLKKHTFYNLLINNILYLCVT